MTKYEIETQIRKLKHKRNKLENIILVLISITLAFSIVTLICARDLIDSNYISLVYVYGIIAMISTIILICLIFYNLALKNKIENLKDELFLQ